MKPNYLRAPYDLIMKDDDLLFELFTRLRTLETIKDQIARDNSVIVTSGSDNVTLKLTPQDTEIQLGLVRANLKSTVTDMQGVLGKYDLTLDEWNHIVEKR